MECYGFVYDFRLSENVQNDGPESDTWNKKKFSEDKLNFISNTKQDHYNKNLNLTSNQTLALVTF